MPPDFLTPERKKNNNWNNWFEKRLQKKFMVNHNNELIRR